MCIILSSLINKLSTAPSVESILLHRTKSRQQKETKKNEIFSKKKKHCLSLYGPASTNKNANWLKKRVNFGAHLQPRFNGTWVHEVKEP